MQYLLYDIPQIWENLKPFTFTRSVAEIRVGVFKMTEKWENHIGTTIFISTNSSLQRLYSLPEANSEVIIINSALFPTKELIEEIHQLKKNECLFSRDIFLAQKGTFNPQGFSIAENKKQSSQNPKILQFPYDIFRMNNEAIEEDIAFIKAQGKSQEITDPHTIIYSPENVFIEEGVTLRACILNASKGSIYIGRNAEIQEGSVLQGPISVGENAVVNIGAKIRGGTTIGTFCKVGGEINNSVFFGYSNKGHDGFLGNSVIGEWCNLGADTNNSNLKNNYKNVKLWSYLEENFVDTGLQFCGLMMSDHSKAGINTMFNTGTVVGVACNIFGGDFPAKFIPSFSWGGAKGFEKYDFEKFLETAELMMQRRNRSLLKEEKEVLRKLYKSA